MWNGESCDIIIVLYCTHLFCLMSFCVFGTLQGIIATTNKIDEPGAALVLTLERTQVSACSCQSLVSKGRFQGNKNPSVKYKRKWCDRNEV